MASTTSADFDEPAADDAARQRLQLSAADLAKRECGILRGFTDQELAHRCLCLGLRPGSELQLLRRSPFGQACYFKADGRNLALRRKEAACLLIERAFAQTAQQRRSA